jgi:hypothetical protein
MELFYNGNIDPHEALPYLGVISEHKAFRSNTNSMLGIYLRKVA